MAKKITRRRRQPSNNAIPMAPKYWPDSDARTLREAEEIKSNSRRHNAALAHAKKEAVSLEKIIKQKRTT